MNEWMNECADLYLVECQSSQVDFSALSWTGLVYYTVNGVLVVTPHDMQRPPIHLLLRHSSIHLWNPNWHQDRASCLLGIPVAALLRLLPSLCFSEDHCSVWETASCLMGKEAVVFEPDGVHGLVYPTFFQGVCFQSPGCLPAGPLACFQTTIFQSVFRPPTVFPFSCQFAIGCVCPRSTVSPNVSLNVCSQSSTCPVVSLLFWALQKFFLVSDHPTSASLCMDPLVDPPWSSPFLPAVLRWSAVCHLPSTCPSPTGLQRQRLPQRPVKTSEEKNLKT